MILQVFNLLKMSSFTPRLMCSVTISQKIIYAHSHVCGFSLALIMNDDALVIPPKSDIPHHDSH